MHIYCSVQLVVEHSVRRPDGVQVGDRVWAHSRENKLVIFSSQRPLIRTIFSLSPLPFILFIMCPIFDATHDVYEDVSRLFINGWLTCPVKWRTEWTPMHRRWSRRRTGWPCRSRSRMASSCIMMESMNDFFTEVCVFGAASSFFSTIYSTPCIAYSIGNPSLE